MDSRKIFTVLAALGVGLGCGVAQGRHFEPFEDISMVLELNETDGDAEVVISAEPGEAITRFRVRAPNRRKVVDLRSRDLANLGLAEIVIESAEPSIEEVQDAYPEGEYMFFAVTVDGTRLFGTAELSHEVLPAPVFSPSDGEEVDPNDVVVSWDAVPGAAGYIVEIEQDDLDVSVEAEVGPETLFFVVPPDLLVPGVEYEVGVAVVSEDDNVTVAESEFVTSLDSEPLGRCPLAFSEEFFPAECTHLTEGANSFFILEPGYRLVLEGEEEDDGEVIELLVCISVLEDIEVVNGIETRVLEEREFEDGELVEVSRNFMTICAETGDLYYHGEDVDDYEDGEIVGHGGAWRAGVDGAVPGVLVPGSPMIGARMFQEIAPGVALDQGTVVSITDGVEVEAGTFDDVLFIYETTALDLTDESFKHYAAGVGLIIDDEIELVEFGFVADPSEPCAEDEGGGEDGDEDGEEDGDGE